MCVCMRVHVSMCVYVRVCNVCVCNESEGGNSRTALFRVITTRAVVISCRRFGTT